MRKLTNEQGTVKAKFIINNFEFIVLPASGCISSVNKLRTKIVINPFNMQSENFHCIPSCDTLL